ncbi:hypothetical protein M9434_000395 [Picochlorum sp. BPE23]|nr:hypothetical protein M9434_000395 [Picochlorum sp. BPE23]KAI8106430.1 hypothetical protein M9435_000974 [Picochlorum sp. BPE23]
MPGRMEDDIDTNVLSPRDSAATGLVMAIFSDCCAYSNVTGLVMATLELDPSVGLVFFPNIKPAIWRNPDPRASRIVESPELVTYATRYGA